MISSMLIKSVAVIVVAYLIGAIPFSYIIGKFSGIDIRLHGSKNPGASNVLRCCGRRSGILAYITDIGKGMVAIVIAHSVVGNNSLVLVVSAFSAILGHVFPVFLGFKGGKGVATSAGVMIVLAPISSLICVVFFFLGLFLSKKVVAIGSTVAALAFPITISFLYKFSPSLARLFFGIEYIYMLAISLLIATFIVVKHIPNYKRLLKGEENAFSKK